MGASSYVDSLNPDFSEEDLPQQPDGIEEDSHDVPAPDKAAERAKAFIEEFGDGIIMAVNKHPLYSRDVWALARQQLVTNAIEEEALREFRMVPEDGGVALYHVPPECCGDILAGCFTAWLDERSLGTAATIAREHNCGEEGNG